MSVTAAKWIDSWARLQFRFFLNLFSCLLTPNLSRRNNRSRAGLPIIFNFGRNGNRQWIPITFHVYSRYLAATRDVPSTATGCKWLAFRFTTMMQRNQSAHTAWSAMLFSLPSWQLYIILHYTMEKKMAAGWSLQNESSSTSREEGRHIKVQRSSFRLNVVLLIIMTMFFRAFIWWAITYFAWNFYWIRLFMRGAWLNTVILSEKYIVPTEIYLNLWSNMDFDAALEENPN